MFQGQSFVLLLDGVGFLFLSFPPEKLRRGRTNIVVGLKHRREKDPSQTSTRRLEREREIEDLLGREAKAYLTVSRSDGDVEEKAKDALQDFSILIGQEQERVAYRQDLFFVCDI